MKKSTILNYKALDIHKGTDSISKRFAILLMMMIMVGSKALAGDSYEVIDGLRYLLNSDSLTATLMANTEKYTGDIVVPESIIAKDGNAYKITDFGYQCFQNCSGLTSVEIPSSITSLVDNCFQNCSGLKSITIPSSVTSLGVSCFQNCKGLTSIEIPSSVTSLGYKSFSGCSSLTTMTIPSSVTSIGGWCFDGCSALTSIKLSSAVASLEDGCFAGCGSLTSITIPASVTSLGKMCFSDCNLENIYFKGSIPKNTKYASIPTTCRIYVPSEYLQEYKDALGFYYNNIYSWNSNEVNDDPTNIYQAKTRGFVATVHDGVVSISGLDNGEEVKFYAADGKFIGQTVATDGTASYAASEALVIAKVGYGSIKIVVK